MRGSLLRALTAGWLGVAALPPVLPAVASGPQPPRTVTVRILAINDLHGALEPPTGTHGRLAGRPVGGLAYLAGHLDRLRREVAHAVAVSAGDNIGATPLVSALFHDEPTIEGLNAAGLELSAVGNHELDEGWRELRRMQAGGCHPRDGCQDATPYDGASFRFLAANIRVAGAPSGGDTLFPPYAVRAFDGVKVGFIGATLHSAPAMLTPAAVGGLAFEDEARAVNRAVAALRRQGVRAIVVLLHQGAEGEGDSDPGCRLSAGMRDIIQRLSPEVDAVVSGHTHRAYTCVVRNTLLTSTGAFGRQITRIDLTINRRTGQVVDRRAENIPVTRDVTPSAAVVAVVDRYRELAVTAARRPAGAIAGPLRHTMNAAGESPLGEVVADAMLAAAHPEHAGAAVLALMNPGGIRTDLVRGADDDAAAGVVTYADVFRVLPFGNQILVKTMTGEALLRLLEQQFDNPAAGEDRILQVSQGFTYRYARTRPPGQRVDRASVRLHGEAVRPEGRYRIAMPDFLWQGGDRFPAALESTSVTPVAGDIDTLVRYLQAHAPVAAAIPNRISREDAR